VAKLIIVLADLQVPYQDPKYINVMRNFIQEMRLSRNWERVEVGQIGDLADQPETGRWNKGAAGEFRGTFWSNMRTTREIIQLLGLDWVKAGNHDRRVEDYIAKYAPALGGDDSEITMESLYGIGKGTRTKLHRNPFRMAPGWVAAHGDEGGLSQVAGQTAFGLTKRWDASVVCGHTHRAGIVSHTIGLPDGRRTITGMEVGNGMLESAATYIKSASPNWQKAFGLFVVEKRHTYDQLIMMSPTCRFTYDGRTYKP
jgi:hypothetical protein